MLFFVVFFSLYGAMHAYAFWKARAALGFGARTGVLVALFLLAMTMAPYLIRLLERNGLDLAARWLSYIGYLWMALLFLFFVSAVAFDVAHLAVRLAERVAHRGLPFTLVPRLSFWLSLTAALAICVYGYFEARTIRPERLTIETAKLPAGIDRFRIVQISDVHLGLIVRCSRMSRILDIVKTEQPDVFVSTGDLVDAEINHLPGLRELLREINPPYGKFAVTGNHEYYAGIQESLAFTRESGFTILQGAAVHNGVITIAGVDDETGAQTGLGRPTSVKALLSKAAREGFVLLLKHRPKIEKGTEGLFDLQLSGHTHRGQIFPFRYASALSYPYNAGRFDIGKGSVLYVSRGTGTWGPPVRFLSPPEVTVIDLVRAPAS